jgi:hypothetical protein
MPYQFTKAYSTRGADMGRPEILGDGVSPVKLHLEQVRMVDGDYDKGGAYWGGGGGLSPLYVAWCPQDLVDEVQVFVRASSRDAAKALIRSRRKNVTFYR